MGCDPRKRENDARPRAGAAEIEVIFHVGGAAPHEANRWAHASAVERFYLSPQRAVERAEITFARDCPPEPAARKV